MLLVGVVAVLGWAAMMGLRSYEYYRRARVYSIQERYLRERAQRDLAQGNTRTIEAKWGLQIADYYTPLVRKYRRAMWRPWIPVDFEPPFIYIDPQSGQLQETWVDPRGSSARFSTPPARPLPSSMTDSPTRGDPSAKAAEN
jgi:hypothetical protein